MTDPSAYEMLFDLVERRASEGLDGATAADLVAKLRTQLDENERLRSLLNEASQALRGRYHPEDVRDLIERMEPLRG